MPRVYISLGSNINKQQNVANGLNALAELYGELTLSSLYESQSLGFDGNDFYNMVIGIDSELPIEDIASQLREIEFRFGREPNATKYSSRTLDLDILLYDDLVLSTPVQIPRDEILTSAFVLWPLAEIAPDHKHPIIQKRFSEIWNEFNLKQQLKPIAFQWEISASSIEV